MKPLLTLIALFLCLTSNAQLAIYKTTGRQTVIAAGSTTRITAHGYMIIDLFSGNGTGVGAFTLNHQKVFVIAPMQNYQFVMPEGAAGTYDVLAKAEAPSTTNPDVLLESAFIQGKAVPVLITPLGVLSIPRSMISVSQSIVNPNGTIGASMASGSGSLDIKGSMTANTNGDSLDTVVNRIVADLTSKGYVQAN